VYVYVRGWSISAHLPVVYHHRALSYIRFLCVHACALFLLIHKQACVPSPSHHMHECAPSSPLTRTCVTLPPPTRTRACASSPSHLPVRMPLSLPLLPASLVDKLYSMHQLMIVHDTRIYISIHTYICAHLHTRTQVCAPPG
jgi:hypothetical protein